MASGRFSPATEAEELADLQHKLAIKVSECDQLRAAVADASAERDATHEAGRAGIQAAKTQLMRLRSELLAVRNWRKEQEAQLAQLGPEEEEADGVEPSGALDADDAAVSPEAVREKSAEQKDKERALGLEVRGLRHELARWKHQAELNEALRPKQEDEIMRLQAELTHVHDILESTRHAVKHHQVERELVKTSSLAADQEEDYEGMQDVPLHGGGHANIEAKAERRVREQAEARNTRLCGKVKNLTGVVAAQQLLIQRLEKQALSQERALEQRETALFHGIKAYENMKGVLRKHSDASVAQVLGVPMRRSSSGPASLSLDGGSPQGSMSTPKLPRIM